MRWLAVISVCLLVAGCDNPVSHRPLLTTSTSSPRLRDGVWASRDYKQAGVDAPPGKDRQETSDAARVQGDTLTDLGDPSKPASRFVLSAGTPMLGQLQTGAREFYFGGVEVERQDGQGRITALRLWPVLRCAGRARPASLAGRDAGRASVPRAGEEARRAGGLYDAVG